MSGGEHDNQAETIGSSGPLSSGRRSRYIFLAAACGLALVAGAWGIRRHLGSPGYLIRHGTPEEQVWALSQLAESGAEKVTVAHALQALESPTPAVRHAAVAALEMIHATDTRDTLARLALKDPDTSVRVHALDVAVGLNPTAANQLLEAALADRASTVRAAAARLVSRYGLDQLRGTVVKRAHDTSPEVHQAAAETLKLLQPEPPDERPHGRPDEPPDERPAEPVEDIERIVWEAEHGVSLRDNFERVSGTVEKERPDDPLFQGLRGYSGDGWVRNLQGAGGNHPMFGGRTGELLVGHVSYPIHVSKAGRYRLWARMWFMDKCGDSFWYWIDNGTQHPVNQTHTITTDPREWRNWVWFPDESILLNLSAGPHTVHVEAREDGVRFDQFCLVREGATPPTRHQGPYAVTQIPARLAAEGFEVSISRDGIVADRDGQIRGSVFVVRRGHRPGAGELQINPADARLASPERMRVTFDGTHSFVRQDVILNFPEESPCCERIITATLTPIPAGDPARAQLIVTKPWPWQFAGPFPFRNGRSAADLNVTGWKQVPVSIYGRYGMLDFQRLFGRTASGVVLLRARIQCEEDGEYLWLLNSDDEARVWMDGTPVIENKHNLPASHLLIRKRVRVSKGEHRIEAAIWQRGFDEIPDIYIDTQNYWQFRLRVRKDPVTPAPIRGILFEESPPDEKTKTSR